MRARAWLIVLLLAPASGCIENMDELKHLLGVRPPAPAPEPPAEAPLVRAQVNATQALVGAPLRFTSEGTRDPAGLSLTLVWSFGDGASAEGASAVHAFDAPGEYAVTLEATNDKGASDRDVVTVTILEGGRAPVALFRIEQDGRNVSSAEAGADVAFDARASYDLDGDALSYLWAFGDGASSFDAAPRHAYAKPGIYTVRLQVSDGERTADASRLLAVNGTLREQGSFGVGDADTRTHAYFVAEGARLLTATLTFDAQLGANDLVLVLRDAEGVEVARTGEETAPGAQGPQPRTVTLPAEALKAQAHGDWTFEVVRGKGVNVAYALEVRETF